MDALFKTLVENSTEAIAMLNADGTVRYASDSSARLLGYTIEERLGQSAFDLVHPDDLARVRSAFAECLDKPAVAINAEYRVRHKNDTWREIEVTAVNRLYDPAVSGVVLNFRDVTERRLNERALRASEARLRHIVEHAQDLIYYCDVNGRFTYVNPAATIVMEYAESELLGRHFMTLIRRDYRDAAGAVYARQMVERLPNTYFEFPAVTKYGDSVWVGQRVHLVIDGETVTGVHAIARDITPQKHAEEQLRKSEARYRSLIQDAAYGIYRTTVEGTILDANIALAHMLGYGSVEELKTLNMASLYKSAEDREALLEQYRRQNNQTLSTDVTWQKKDGTPITVHLAARVVEMDEDRVCFEGLAEDVTERRALEEQVRQAQKMEAVARLARGVAHDFNNVLAAIIGCSDLLAMRLKPGDPSLEEAEEIRQAAERGAALTRQLMAFSRSQALELKIVPLDALVTQIAGRLQRLVGDGAVVRVHTAGVPTPVRIDPGQLEQALTNLLLNARDAMPDGGTIDVGVDAVDLDARSASRYPPLPPGPYGRITVTDTGIGMEPEMQAHIFEPFFTTKSADKSAGLGLSIVYGIAKDAGGTVAFTSRPNEGTTFEVMLPLQESLDPGS